MNKRFLILLAIIVAVTGFAAESFSQQYPERAIRLIVPYAPGGSADIQARAIGQKMSESWGRPVVVDNRSGGNTVIGTDLVAKALPDGYTMILVAGSFTTLPSLYKKLPYDTLQDLAPVTLVSSTPYILVVHPKLGVKSIRELIGLLKSKPGQFNYASTSAGGMSHIAAELFKFKAGIIMQHVPYKGSGAALPDVLGGHVPLIFENILSVLPHVKAGKLYGLAVSTLQRSAIVPELPTVAESGLPGFDVTNWFGVLVPAKTPKTIVTHLNGEIVRILSTPELRERMSSAGAEVIGSAPEQLAQYIRTEIVKYGEVIRHAGIRLD